MVLFFECSFFCVIKALFPTDGSKKVFIQNFPTCVGDVPPLTHSRSSRLPHASGDVPVPKKHGVVTDHSMFPTNVWMFLFTFLKIFSLPHECGDVHGV